MQAFRIQNTGSCFRSSTPVFRITDQHRNNELQKIFEESSTFCMQYTNTSTGGVCVLARYGTPPHPSDTFPPKKQRCICEPFLTTKNVNYGSRKQAITCFLILFALFYWHCFLHSLGSQYRSRHMSIKHPSWWFSQEAKEYR